MAAIWVLSSLPLGVPVEDFPLRDKGVHLVEYGGLGFLLAHAAFRTWPRHHPLRTGALALLIAVLWGFLDEIHQASVPGRASDALDLLADTIGATAGVALRALVRGAASRARRRSERAPSRRAEERASPRPRLPAEALALAARPRRSDP
jgi:VanZ family protein